jgi:hypothetical protein
MEYFTRAAMEYLWNTTIPMKYIVVQYNPPQYQAHHALSLGHQGGVPSSLVSTLLKMIL